MTKMTTFLATGIACLLTTTAIAQDTTDTVKKSKIFDHRIGVQANELIRQVFNFNNSTVNTLNNPYLLTYSLTLAKPGIGLRLGIGPDYSTFNNDDGVTKVENNINKLNARAGLEKIFILSDKWSAGAGIDVIFSNDVSYSKTQVRSFDSALTDIATKEKSIGYGAMGWLRYHISPRIHIGTETSFYYRTGNVKQKIEITRKVNTFPNGNTTQTTTDEVDNKLKEGIFRLPMVFYLVVMF